jgi:hypothetical protein
MRSVLKSKAAYSNDQVAEVWRNIEWHVTEDEAWRAVDRAAAEVRATCASYLDRVVYGWSGGKDSIALQVVMERAGVNRALLGVIPHLEFRQYLDWVDSHQPEGLTVIGNDELTVEWLGRPGNDRYLFPRNSKDGYFWTLAGTRRAQHIYQEQAAPELQIYGRRTQDGNVCGDPSTGIALSKRLTAYCPIRGWSHELVLAVVHYANRPLPPVYGWPHGWTAGTGSWPGRRVGTYDESWAETWEIEPNRLREAALHIPAARAWMDRRGVS